MNPEQFITSYTAALATQNWQNVAPLICPNACVTFSNGSVHKGIKAIQEAYERNFSIIKSEEYLTADIYWLLKIKKQQCTFSVLAGGGSLMVNRLPV